MDDFFLCRKLEMYATTKRLDRALRQSGMASSEAAIRAIMDRTISDYQKSFLRSLVKREVWWDTCLLPPVCEEAPSLQAETKKKRKKSQQSAEPSRRKQQRNSFY